jgi:hypothetical protein
VDLAQFRLDFPEFGDTAKYTNSQLTFWATFAEAQLNQDVFDTMYTFAVKLYVAHEITLAAQNMAASAAGGSPGQQGGIANSKTVGSVSVSFDATLVSEKDAGWWNLTNYGKQLYRLIQMYGAGAIQL